MASSIKNESNCDTEKLSFRDKTGLWATVVLSVGPVLILAAMGVLSFLWFGDKNNQTWTSIVQRNWATTAVAICSEVIKMAISFQLAVMAAMLASLALERSEVLLPSLAELSMMRATSSAGTTVIMLWHYLVGFWHARFRLTLVFSLLVLASLLFGLTHVTSVLLISDMGLSTVPGPIKTVNRSFSFAYRYPDPEEQSGQVSTWDGYILDPPPKISVMEVGGTWYRKPSVYPTFAELSEPPYQAEGVVDTGRTLRAFLPHQQAIDRERLMSYSRTATVLDARVTCQSPEFIDPRLRVVRDYGSNIIITGAVRALHNTARLGNASVNVEPHKNPSGASIKSLFSCLATLPYSSTDANEEWKISICQLANGLPTAEYNGGLISEFKDASTWWSKTRNSTTMQESSLYGNAYLVLNVTRGNDQDIWRAILEQSDVEESPGYRPPAFSRRSEWYDMIFDSGRHTLSATLCHTAFDLAQIPVNITSTHNRTEPTPLFDFSKRRFTFPQIRALLGQNRSLSLSDRGVLRLQPKNSWTANGDENPISLEPYIRSFADLALSDKFSFDSGNTGNVSGLLYSQAYCGDVAASRSSVTDHHKPSCKKVDPMHLWLFQEILRTGGSVAFALQSLITVLSGMAYYDQMGLFDNSTMAEEAFFVVASVPVRRAGFVTVVVAVVVHLVLAGVVVWVFLEQTAVSRLGAAWSALAQASTGDAETHIRRSGLWGDEKVEEVMDAEGVKPLRAGLVKDRNGEVVVAVMETPTTVYQACGQSDLAGATGHEADC